MVVVALARYSGSPVPQALDHEFWLAIFTSYLERKPHISDLLCDRAPEPRSLFGRRMSLALRKHKRNHASGLSSPPSLALGHEGSCICLSKRAALCKRGVLAEA